MNGKTRIPTTSEMTKEMALEQFVRRKRYAQQIEKIDNAGLHAGQPMYFYCKNCGVPTEVLPEDFLFTPHESCSQCDGLKSQGWMAEAVAQRE